jgi:hypothetical protein
MVQRFYLTNLGSDQIIIGYPFLAKFNPKIDWKTGTFQDGTIRLESSMYKYIPGVVERLKRMAITAVGCPGNGEAIFMRKISLSQQMAHEHEAKKEQTPFEIPPQFRKYKKVFLEEEAKRFPPNRGQFNVSIRLKKDAPEQLNCKIYPLTKQEDEALRKYLDEELEKGFIVEGASPYTSPVFFIAKKESSEK